MSTTKIHFLRARMVDGIYHDQGSVASLPDDQALRLIAQGSAEIVLPEPAPDVVKAAKVKA